MGFKNLQKTVWVKVVVLLIIVVAIGGIWFLKQRGKSAQTGAGQTLTVGGPLAVTDAKELERIRSLGLPVVIDFGADSCVPCKEMAPVLEELNRTLQGKAVVKFVDVWKYKDLAEGYPLRVIPTQFFFDKDGKPFRPSDGQLGMILYADKDSRQHAFTAHEGGMTRGQLLAVLKEMGVPVD